MKQLFTKTICIALSLGLAVSPSVSAASMLGIVHAEESTPEETSMEHVSSESQEEITDDGTLDEQGSIPTESFVFDSDVSESTTNTHSDEEEVDEDPGLLLQLSETQEVFEDTEEPEIIYQISSQQEWNDLVHGISDSANWTDGCYTGTKNFLITLGCDVVSDVDIISIYNDNVAAVFNLDGHTLSSATGTFGIKHADSVSGANKTTGAVTVCSGEVSGTALDFSQGASDVDIHDVTFTNCSTNAVNARQISKNISITNCSITHVKSDNTDTAIICSYACNNGNRLIQDVTISGFNTGIDGTYSSVQGTDLFQRITMEDVNTGINLDYGSNQAKILNCDIRGAGKSGSQGVRMMPGGASKVQFAMTERVYSYIDDCQISGFDFGVYCNSGMASVYNSEITNVNHGMYANSGALCIKDSIIMANEQVADGTYSGDSYGVYGPTMGFCIINTDIKGFKIGACNTSADGFVGASILDNIDYNVKGQCDVIYNCLLKNANCGIYANSAEIYVVDTTITGSKAAGSIGAYDYRGAKFELIGTSDDYPLESLNLSFGYQDVAAAVRDSYTSRSYDMMIQDYDIGAKTVSNFIECHNLEVSGCNTGLNGGTFHFGSAKDTVNTPVHIHDCVNGIISAANFVDSSDVYIYDCAETGLTVSTQLSGSTNPELKVEVSNCSTGMVLSGSITGPHLISHDNKNDGIQLKENANCFTGMESYNNAGWNVYCDGVSNTYFLNASGQTNRLTNGGLGNLYVNAKNPSAMSVAVTGDNITSDNSIIYLENGNTLYVLPKGSSAWQQPTDWLQGAMTFDVPEENYMEGTPVVSTVRTYVHNTNDQFGNAPNLFVRTHFFAKEEGWMIDWTDESRGVSGDSQLILAEGCNVTYDFATNGGTEIVSSFPMNGQNRISYRKGNMVDLSLSAVRDEYEFIGWNTDPNAHEGLESLTAGVKDITLYAIYRNEVTYTYHTYDSTLDFTQGGYHFNKEARYYADETGTEMLIAAKYADMVSGSRYTFAGYTYQSDSTKGIFTEGTELSGVCDIYCLYWAKSVLSYYTPKSVLYNKEELNEICTSTNVADHVFYYNLIGYQSERGYRFQWWNDSTGNTYGENDTFVTQNSEDHLIAEVSPIYVDSITVTPKEVEIEILGNQKLIAIVGPEDALDKSVTWSSSDSSVATVDSNGLVTAVGEGTVIITATANDGSGCSDFAVVTINGKSLASSTSTEVQSQTPATGDNTPVSLLVSTLLFILTFLLNLIISKKKKS